MKILHYVLSFLCVFIFILITLILSFEMAVFYNYKDYFKKQYEKNDIENKLNMDMSDILKVTDKIINYLKNKDDNLSIEVLVNGNMRQFFNEQELAHMEDAKEIFLIINNVKIYSFIFLFIIIIILIMLKVDWINIFPRAYFLNCSIFILLFICFILAINIDFKTFFYGFHNLIFDNDLWLFNSSTSLIVKLFPEKFFFDISLKITFIFLIFLFFYTIFFIKWSLIIKKRK